MINLKAYAKLNLFLNITGKLDNGYHTLEMVMQSIDLFDSVSIEKTDGFCVVCEGIDMLHNSAYRAGLAFFQKAGILPSAKISISKRIPVMAGLGGGSADAAAAILGLNELYQKPLSYCDMQKIAKGIGADVPFALKGGCAVARGIGEILEPVSNNMECCYLIIKPIQGCNTALCYSKYDEKPIKSEKDALINTIKSIENGNIKDFAQSTFNALTVSAVDICPSIASVLTVMKAQTGCLCAFMTGSGSACVCIFENMQCAQKAKKNALLQIEGAFACICKNVSSGIEITN